MRETNLYAQQKATGKPDENESVTFFDFRVVGSRIKATFHLTISMRDQRAMGKIQRNNYRHGSCGPFLTGKTSWVSQLVSLIFAHGTYRMSKIVK